MEDLLVKLDLMILEKASEPEFLLELQRQLERRNTRIQEMTNEHRN